MDAPGLPTETLQKNENTMMLVAKEKRENAIDVTVTRYVARPARHVCPYRAPRPLIQRGHRPFSHTLSFMQPLLACNSGTTTCKV